VRRIGKYTYLLNGNMIDPGYGGSRLSREMGQHRVMTFIINQRPRSNQKSTVAQYRQVSLHAMIEYIQHPHLESSGNSYLRWRSERVESNGTPRQMGRFRNEGLKAHIRYISLTDRCLVFVPKPATRTGWPMRNPLLPVLPGPNKLNQNRPPRVSSRLSVNFTTFAVPGPRLWFPTALFSLRNSPHPPIRHFGKAKLTRE